MKNIIIVFIVALSIISIGCHSINSGPESSLILNDTIEIYYNERLENYESEMSIAFESVLNDSRCPTGPVACKWAGDATVRFEFILDNEITIIDLHTNSQFFCDTTVKNYSIYLVKLNPYPVYNEEIMANDYRAKVIINSE
jgi:hypothetical protein